jgi:hypothetical protein
MKVPGGGGSLVRMYNPPNPRLATRESSRVLVVCQAKMVPLGEETRGQRRRSFVVVMETPERTILLFRGQLKPVSDELIRRQ